MLDVRRLRTFLAVATEGSFTGAARALFVTHSAVSQQMSILEREVGLPLIERTPRGIALTQAGRLLADSCTTLFNLLATIESEMRDLRTPAAEVRLGAFPTASADLVPRVLIEFERRRPQATVTFIPVHVDEIPNRLRDGTIHLGLGWDYESMPRQIAADVHLMHLYDEPLDLLIRADHPLAGRSAVGLEELSDSRWVFRHHRPPYESAFSIMCRSAGFEPNIAFTTDDYQAIHGFVGAGLGVSLVPRLSLQVRHPDVVAVPVSQHSVRRNIFVLSLAGARLSETAAELISVMQMTAEQLRISDGVALGPSRSTT